MRMKHGEFPGRVPDGPVRNITPVGTVRDKGDQAPYANGWMGQGTLGTVSVGRKTGGIEPNHNKNRTGEGGY